MCVYIERSIGVMKQKEVMKPPGIGFWLRWSMRCAWLMYHHFLVDLDSHLRLSGVKVGCHTCTHCVRPKRQ
jgi:hypothetical protein